MGFNINSKNTILVGIGVFITATIIYVYYPDYSVSENSQPTGGSVESKLNNDPAKKQSVDEEVLLTEYWKIDLLDPENIEEKLKLAQSCLDMNQKKLALKILQLSAESSLYKDLEIAAFYRDRLSMKDKAEEMVKRAELVSFQAVDTLKLAHYFKDSQPQKCRDYVLKAARSPYTVAFGNSKVFESRAVIKLSLEDVIDFCLEEVNDKKLAAEALRQAKIDDLFKKALLQYRIDKDPKPVNKLLSEDLVFEDYFTLAEFFYMELKDEKRCQLALEKAGLEADEFYELERVIIRCFERNCSSELIQKFLKKGNSFTSIKKEGNTTYYPPPIFGKTLKTLIKNAEAYEKVKDMQGIELAEEMKDLFNEDLLILANAMIKKTTPSLELSSLLAAQFTYEYLKDKELIKLIIDKSIANTNPLSDLILDKEDILDAALFCFEVLKDDTKGKELIQKLNAEGYHNKFMAYMQLFYEKNPQKAKETLLKSLKRPRAKWQFCQPLRLYHHMTDDSKFCKEKLLEHLEKDYHEATESLLFALHSLDDEKLTRRMIDLLNKKDLPTTKCLEVAIFCLTRLKDKALAENFVRSQLKHKPDILGYDFLITKFANYSLKK